MEKIDNCFDISIRNKMYEEIHKQKEIDRLANLLDMAEAVRMGTASIQGKKSHIAYVRWFKKMSRKLRRLYGEEKQNTPLVWDNLKKSKRF